MNRYFYEITGGILDHVISKNELVQKLEVMNKTNLDKVDGFIKCLISQRALSRQNETRRKPLLAIKKRDE
jgi:hypothetical protein